MRHAFVFILVYLALFLKCQNAFSEKVDWKIFNKEVKYNNISFFDIYSNPKKYDGNLIVIYGTLISSTSEYADENHGKSNYGNGFLFFDKSHYEIKDFSSAISIYFKCDADIDIHAFDGKTVAVVGAYWNVEQGIGNKNMGVIQLGGIIGINADGTKNPIVFCSNELNGVPGTRPK